jgi:hypothetical protein
MARKPMIPGEFDEPVQAPSAPLLPDPRLVSAGIPDFTQKSIDAAIRWFADHPDAPRRNVLTAEGWYVHPVTPELERAAKLGR